MNTDMTSNQATYIDDRYPLSALTGRIIAAAKEVHRDLGPGFREVVYQRALALELPTHDLECSREVWINIHFKGHPVGRTRVDFIIGDDRDNVMLEVKAKGSLEESDLIQAVSYLKASGHKVGLLINFGAKVLEIRRLAN
jgi:GxxExxY protein